MKLAIYLIVLFILGYLSQKQSGKCRVLALEGGGDKGAYQAGVIKGLTEFVHNKTELQWDVITGISVGALNAGGFALFKKGEEIQAADFLLQVWRTIKNDKSIFKNWLGIPVVGPVYGLMFKSSFFSTEPLKEFLHSFIKEKTPQREVYVGATNIANGHLDIFDNKKNMSVDDYVDTILASSAYPVIFPNRDYKNNTYMDGGVKMSVDVFSGIDNCYDKGYNYSDIIVDVVLCSTKKLNKVNVEDMKTFEVLARSLYITDYDRSMKAVDEVYHDYPEVTLRYVIGPTQPLPSGAIPLNFSPEQIENMISIGIADAKNFVEISDILKNKKSYKPTHKADRLSMLMKEPTRFEPNERAEGRKEDELFLN